LAGSQGKLNDMRIMDSRCQDLPVGPGGGSLALKQASCQSHTKESEDDGLGELHGLLEFKPPGSNSKEDQCK
jgi:hypothetical protein